MLLFRLPSRIHPSPRKRPTILQKAGVKEVSVPSMHRYAIRSPFTISPAFFHMHRPCRSDIQNGWLSVVMTGSQRPWASRRIILLLWLFMTALHFLNRPSFVRISSPVLISLIGFNPLEVRTSVSPSKQGNPPCKDIDLPSPVPKIGRGNVRIALGVRKPIIQNPVAERINLAVESVLPSHSFGGQVGSAESTEQGSVYQRLPSFLFFLFFFHRYSLFKGSIFMVFASILR